MSSEKRLALCMVLTLGSVYGLQFAMERTGVLPPPAKKPQAVAGAGPEVAGIGADRGGKPELPLDVFRTDRQIDDEANAPAPGGPPLALPDELVLGRVDAGPGLVSPYRLVVELAQKGATVAKASSTRFDAEFDPNNRKARPGPLALIVDDPRSTRPGSLAIRLPAGNEAKDAAEAVESAPWEVVRDGEGKPAVRAITKADPKAPGGKVAGQELAFRLKVDGLATITKTFRLYEGEDGFEVELRFAGAGRDARFAYTLFTPHGIPIEGAWYTSTFRDVFFGQVKGDATDITTRTAYDAVKYKDDPTQRVSALPLKFAGVEDQYFATFVQPWPIARTLDERIDAEADSFIIKEDATDSQKSDVCAAITSRPLMVGPNAEAVHTYRVFAGAKTAAALLPFEADELASYRKNQWITIPFASTLAKNVIAPMLDRIYALTESAARLFGGTKGNFGISIILLTMLVRLIMFPIGRKQAMMAKKMQDLQPILAEVKEKYKDDKEALTRETMAVWKRNKVNPAAGCLPALIQMPIFVGLWQSLNNSVALRHSSFLYIKDLAAPDMMFRFPFDVPFLGQFFNLLPFLVVALMLVQTKLFAPPPTTPEAEMNQKMMKYMMLVMAVMFYKVPSGLGLYFITSSLWQVCERLLLPKVIAAPVKPIADDDFGGGGNGRGPGGGPNGNGNGNGNGMQGWIGKRLEKILEEAATTKTIRNGAGNGADKALGRDRPGGGPGAPGRDRDRDRPRNKPPGKRR